MIQAIFTLFRTFFEMCLLKRKPQDLPHSQELLALFLIIYTLINILLLWTSAGLDHAIFSAVLETTLMILITYAILRLNKHPGRTVKTLIALAGTGCIVSVVAIPLFLAGMLEPVTGAIQSLILLFYLLLLVWNVVIMGHILRHALDTSLGAGVIFAIIYILITSMLISVTLPETGAL